MVNSRTSRITASYCYPNQTSDIISLIQTIPQLDNVKNYGAKGDGISDDTISIQLALDSSTNIYFPPGIYIITSPLRYNAHQFISDQGGDLAIIKQKDGAMIDSILTPKNSSGIIPNNLTIFRISIDGNIVNNSGANTIGVKVWNPQPCMINQVHIYNCYNGISSNRNPVVTPYFVTILSVINFNTNYGIELLHRGTISNTNCMNNTVAQLFLGKNVSVYNSTLIGSTTTGTTAGVIINGNNVYISDSSINSNVGHGIEILNTNPPGIYINNIFIYNNRIVGNSNSIATNYTKSGIHLTSNTNLGVSNIDIQGNKIAGNPDTLATSGGLHQAIELANPDDTIQNDNVNVLMNNMRFCGIGNVVRYDAGNAILPNIAFPIISFGNALRYTTDISWYGRGYLASSNATPLIAPLTPLIIVYNQPIPFLGTGGLYPPIEIIDDNHEYSTITTANITTGEFFNFNGTWMDFNAQISITYGGAPGWGKISIYNRYFGTVPGDEVEVCILDYRNFDVGETQVLGGNIQSILAFNKLTSSGCFTSIKVECQNGATVSGNGITNILRITPQPVY